MNLKPGDKVWPRGDSWATSEWVNKNAPAVVLEVLGPREIKIRWKCGLVDTYKMTTPLEKNFSAEPDAALPLGSISNAHREIAHAKGFDDYGKGE